MKKIPETFTEISADRAIAFCRPHAHDWRVLLTKEPQGLWALREPYVKAVILAREVEASITNFFNTAGAAREETWNITPPSQDWQGRLGWGAAGAVLPTALKQDAQDLCSVARTVFNTSPAVFVNTHRSGGARYFHMDSGWNLIAAYTGPGVRIYPGALTDEEYTDIMLHGTGKHAGVMARLGDETVPTGHIAVIKGITTESEGTCPGSFVRSLPHATPPDPFDGIPDEKRVGSQCRFALVMHT